MTQRKYRLAGVALTAKDGWRRLRGALSPTGLRGIGKPPKRLVIAPQDIRTSDPSIAGDIYAGLFALAGRAVHTQGHSPFAVEPPSFSWAAELHGFGWLRHLRAANNAVSRANARALLIEWLDQQSGHPTGVARQPGVTARRLMSLLSQSPLLLEGAEDVFYGRFLRQLGQDARLCVRHLEQAEEAERLLCCLALAYFVVCSEQPEGLSNRVGELLERAIRQQILPDGGHSSRNPQMTLEFLLDFLPLRQGYVARRAPPPQELIGAIDRMMPMLRMLRHGDGTLALFNGMGVTAPDLLATALAYDDAHSKPLETAPNSGYQRLAAEDGSLVIVDTGLPARGGGLGHAGALAFEFSDGVQKLVVNCGEPYPDRLALRQAARSSAAHSTLIVDDTSSSRFLDRQDKSGRTLSYIVEGPRHVPVTRRQEEGYIAVTASHDGYAHAFGLLHERSLALAETGVQLIGIDRLMPVKNKAKPVNAALRFHLHPQVKASLQRGGARVLLQVNAREAWFFEAEGHAAVLEESVLFASLEGARRSQQILIAFPVNGEIELRWRFARMPHREQRRPSDAEAEPSLPLE